MFGSVWVGVGAFDVCVVAGFGSPIGVCGSADARVVDGPLSVGWTTFSVGCGAVSVAGGVTLAVAVDDSASAAPVGCGVSPACVSPSGVACVFGCAIAPAVFIASVVAIASGVKASFAAFDAKARHSASFSPFAFASAYALRYAPPTEPIVWVIESVMTSEPFLITVFATSFPTLLAVPSSAPSSGLVM